MNPAQKAGEIRRLLAKYKIGQAQIAKRAQVSTSDVREAISRPSRSNRILKVIWEMLKEKSADESKIAFILGEDEEFTHDQPPVKRLLKQAGLTQRYIAQKAQVSCAVVSMTVNGRSKSKRIEEIIRQEAEKALAKHASTRIDNWRQENPGHGCELLQDAAEAYDFEWTAEGRVRTLKKQSDQQISVLASKAQEYLRMIKDNVANSGFENQISGWITVLDTWRRIWEAQEEKNTQPGKKDHKTSYPAFSVKKMDYLEEYREQLLRDLKKNTKDPALSRAVDGMIELCQKKEDDISYPQFKANVMRLYADFLEIRLPSLENR